MPICERAFKELKGIFCRHIVLCSPNFKKEFVLQTDALAVELGAVLSQEVDGEQHLTVYISQKFFPHRRVCWMIESMLDGCQVGNRESTVVPPRE